MGQSALAPSQVSAASQAPADARQAVPAGLKASATQRAAPPSHATWPVAHAPALHDAPTAASQPSAGLPLQSAQPASHAKPHAPAALDLGPLAPGTMTASGAAFNAACASVTASTVPTWVSDPVSVAVVAGLTAEVALTLRPNVRGTARVDFVSPAVAVVARESSTYAVMQDGTVRAWGENADGQLGDGTVTPRSTPVRVMGLANARQVRAGEFHARALLGDGSARCWGRNAYGQLGDGTTTDSAAPVAAAGALRFARLALGAEHTCGVTSDEPHTLYCWGRNDAGQLGDGTTTGRPAPVQSSDALIIGEAFELTAGPYATCAQRSFGWMTCAGFNGFGAFANGSTVSPTRPTRSGYTAGASVELGGCTRAAFGPTGRYSARGATTRGSSATARPRTAARRPP